MLHGARKKKTGNDLIEENNVQRTVWSNANEWETHVTRRVALADVTLGEQCF